MRTKALTPILLGVILAAVIFVQPQAPPTNRQVLISEKEARPAPAAAPEAAKPRVVAAYGRLPLSFEANQGQTDPQVKFLSRGTGYTLFLNSTKAVLALGKAVAAQSDDGVMPATTETKAAESKLPTVLQMKLRGANPNSQVAGLEQLPGKSNYFIGNDPAKWHTNVPRYAKVQYQSIYPGVDLVYYGTNQRELEYDFVVAPGADPNAIRLSFEGAGRVEVDAEGNLILHLSDGKVRFHKPRVYQEVNGQLKEVTGSYVLDGKNEIAFEVAAYDPSRPLIIDPVLSYCTYLGGKYDGQGNDLSIDSAGNAYVTGSTLSKDFPIANALQTTKGGMEDAFVAKLNPDGTRLLYATYLGGGSSDLGISIAVDAAGNAYVGGRTGSKDFPTERPFQEAKGGKADAFMAKVDSDGNRLIYSTHVGGKKDDELHGIAVDAAGYAYITGHTYSKDFPTENPFQAEKAKHARTSQAKHDAFVAKLKPDGSALVFSTYLGGNRGDSGHDIAGDTAGYVYVTGDTSSKDFPTANPFQAVRAEHSWLLNDDERLDAFVAKLNPDGSALTYSTYLGGGGRDSGLAIAVDASGNAYMTGVTGSKNFPTANPLQPARGGGLDAFVAKFATGVEHEVAQGKHGKQTSKE